MLEFIDEILTTFRPCFSRKAAFNWFVVLVTGFLLRTDQLGVTSVIRDLALKPHFYETMLHFFRATSWSLDNLRLQWYRIVLKMAPLHRVDGYAILIGDGVKQAKEARFMPAVKKLFQESENSSKPEYIFGHMYGGLGILAGNISKWFCIPLSISLHDGLQPASKWAGSGVSTTSHVVHMVENGYEAAKIFGKSLLLLDRYFLSVPALKRLCELNATNATHMELVTKAKKSCCAYEKPPVKKPGRGRPCLKGQSIKLMELFASHTNQFKEVTLTLYGKEEQIRYYCTNLLWGQKLYQELHFVLVEYQGIKSILVSTSLTLDPLEIIRLYSYRFRIESLFRELKQQIGCFCYHFWTRSMPKLNRYQKKTAPHPLEQITSDHARKKIMEAVKAIEGHVMLSVIAMGILQMTALKFSSGLDVKKFRYLRTPSLKIVSEATIMCYLRKHIFRIMVKKPHLSITQIIMNRQEESTNHKDLQAS